MAETLDEAVARIVWEKTDLCGKQAEDCKAAIRQGIAWARERDAQIAGEWARGSLELAKIAQQCGCPDDARLHRLDSHVAIAIAGAIREEASRG